MAELFADLFDDLIGQAQAISLLQATLAQGRLATAYLFVGPDGVGRRLAARRFLEGLLAGPDGSVRLRRRLLEGNHPDLLWLEPTYQHQGQLVPASQAAEQGLSKRGLPQLRLEQVREISRFLSRRPLESSRCLVVIEAVEAMAEGAANALLKTLEEPGEGVLILLSSAPERLLATIRSRCQQIPFARLDATAMARVLDRLDPAQSSQPDPDPPALLDLAAGSPGALLHHREQWRALPKGLAGRLLEGSPAPIEALALARDLCEALDLDQQLWLLNWWQWQRWQRDHRASDQRRIERLRGQLRGFVQPRLAWEVALLELMAQEGQPG
ncbi:MAG: DNA polymerase III subunit delta' [Synechococcaceae cyanobacterium MAG-AL2]|uniref:DNA polymerase III subunit delta' n=1 Tax=Candidatus Regnicoccus frigidus TaxID=3074015 RepID=UPI0028291147|nr:DNA polymerase III subunit delta' [Candidatus Regnicoccus frigidus]MCT4363499.1 DNA polymerase III subunit delta' [Candidatus Regnicoccus frigidus MAG-AL1]MCT4366799.1 DNA polymerase III subunit delta' [Candidatus Regnicoccus frigidus MAG-AL2]